MFPMILALLAQASTVDAIAALVPEQAVSVAAPAGGTIIVYRPSSIVGAGVACPIRYKEQEIVELGRGKFAEVAVPSGRFILTNKTSSVEVIVDPGETRYVRCTIKPGFMTGRADLQIVDRETFAEHQADFERKDVAFQVGQ